MRGKVVQIGVLTLILSFVYSCKKEEDDCPAPAQTDSLILSFSASTAGFPLEFKKEFNDPLNRKMRVELLKYYVSNIYLINGVNEKKVGDVGLLTFENNGEPDPGDELQKIRMIVPTGSYTGIRFGIGLDETTNATNPSSYSDEHPLSVQQGTYWSTWDKYRFFLIEGRMDGDGDGQLTDLYGYHTGFDICYKEKSFQKNFKVQKGSTMVINFSFEINDVFFGSDTLDAYTEPFWHGDTILVDRAIRISDNFINALKIE